MSHAGTEDKFIKTLFPSKMDGVKIIDVGHGYGETALYIRTRTYKQGWCHLTGLDVFPEYHNLMKKLAIYDDLALGDARDIPFEDKDFDISIAQHVIEHLSKEDGYRMIAEMERITRDRLILCTPNGYTESGPLDDNDHNNHLSGWTTKDFENLGYNVQMVTKNVNSRLLQSFAKTVFKVRGKRWDNEVLVAWKDLPEITVADSTMVIQPEAVESVEAEPEKDLVLT